jgi:hypothetical protein
MSKDKHEHEFKEIQLIRITQVQTNYKGTSGDKALLVRACKCSKYKAIEYGGFTDMVKFGKKLKGVTTQEEGEDEGNTSTEESGTE